MVAVPALAIGYGLYILFALRLETGDVYPADSSLRADPLGTRMLYESLESMPGLTVTRNYTPLIRVSGSPGSTFLFLGLESRWIPESFYRELSRLMLEGGRVVIGFAHEKIRASYDEEEQVWATNDTHCVTDAGTNTNVCASCSFWLRDRRLWGASLEYEGLALSATSSLPTAPASDVTEIGGLGPVRWPTALFFQPLEKNWRTLYVRDGKPVLIERPFGKGSVVLAADGYFLSNEALLKERESRLIGLVLGKAGSVVFDESHLGVRDTSGVMVLVWKYRLYGLVFALLLLAALFLWSVLSPLLPMAEDIGEMDDRSITGMDVRQGYLQLLKRHIPVSNLLSLCVEEWEKSVRASGRAGKRTERVRAILAQSNTDPVQGYRHISQCIKESGKI